MFHTAMTADQAERFNRCLTDILDVFGEGSTYYADNLITIGRSVGFLQDPAFRAAFDAAEPENMTRALAWRLHVLVWAAHLALMRDGDFVECGVYEGFSSRVLTHYLDFASLPRRYFLYDIFDNPGSDGFGSVMPAHSSKLEQRVRRRFADVPNVVVVPGMLPGSLAKAAPDKIAFLHLDLNNAEAERTTLAALYDRISPGAPMVFDDYGWLSHHKQKDAIDAFLGERNVRVMELPTGQGLAIKP